MVAQSQKGVLQFDESSKKLMQEKLPDGSEMCLDLLLEGPRVNRCLYGKRANMPIFKVVFIPYFASLCYKIYGERTNMPIFKVVFIPYFASLCYKVYGKRANMPIFKVVFIPYFASLCYKVYGERTNMPIFKVVF